jgi:hypothetical protein
METGISAGTTITNNMDGIGLLTVAENETLAELTIYVVSVYDASKSATCTVTVTSLSHDVKDFGPNPVISNIFNVSTTALWNDAVSAITNGDSNKNYVINVIGDDPITVIGTTTATFGYEVTDIKVSLRGEGGTLALSGEGSILYIGETQTVILRNLTLKGHSSNNASLVHVDGGVLEMNGGEISKNTAFGGSGGGVCVKNYGTFTMNGGVISGNKAITSVPGS